LLSARRYYTPTNTIYFFQFLTYTFTVLTLGIFRLILHWYPEWLVKCTANKSALSVADHVLVVGEHQNVVFRPIRMLESSGDLSSGSDGQVMMPAGGGRILQMEKLRYFTYRHALSDA